MRVLFLAAAMVFSIQSFAKASRDGGIYHGENDGSVCYFDIWTDYKNLKFQIAGNRVTLGTQGVPISPTKVRFEGTVWFDYATGRYEPEEPHHAGAQYLFTLILEFGPYGQTVGAVMTREKISGYLPDFTRTAKCEGIQLVQAYRRNMADETTCSSSVD